MEEIYLLIAERLQDKAVELNHIDEDTGQLYPTQYDDRYEYPVLFPCALVDAHTVDWKAGGAIDRLRGGASVTIKLAFKCDEDTHYSSAEHGNTFQQMRGRQAVRKKVAGALNGFCLAEGMAPMFRVQSRSYTLPGRVRVYEETFNVNVTESLEIGE